MVMLFRWLQRTKVEFSILFIPIGKMTVFSRVHPAKAWCPTELIVDGSVTEVRYWQP